jgi:serine/threonine-protein kinase
MPALSPQVALPDRYRLVRHIANGGMASVWAAEDSLLERLVAVKVLAPGYAADPAARRRFTREARAAARVSDHPHVVTVFDIGESTDQVPQAFIVMEHLAGGTVADRLRRGEPVPIPTSLRWLGEAASALDAAHAADIVHRDVKPGNLLLDERGRLAVGDFGIASIAGDTQVTAAGQVLGTAAYLSPEQARGNPATPASDRYSLAVVAYELLCGKRPFDGDTPIAQARAHAEVEPPTPTGPCGSAADVLKYGLAKDPAQRPPSAAAFVEELEDVLGDLTEPRRTAPATSATVPLRRSSGPEWNDDPRFERRVAPRTPTPTPAPARATPMPAPAPVARQRSRHRSAGLLAVLAILCVAGGAAAALIGDNGNLRGASSTPTAAGSAAFRPNPKHATRPKTTAAPASGPAASTPTASTPAPATADGRSAAQLNNTGYGMLPSDPQGALPLLQRAVQMFRTQGDRSSTDYAYSLYNLGWALRLGGHPADAIPYLQERLAISNYKRGIVAQELRTAQQAAGQPVTGPGAAKKHGGGQQADSGNNGNNGN